MKEKVFGVEFAGKNGKRLYDAADFVAEVGVDDQIVRNDFDNVFPWAGMRRCNTEIINGERFPSWFEGEEGFDNVNKDVFVYVPLFFYQRKTDGETETCVISTEQGQDMIAPRKFKRADGSLRDFVFLPAYTAGIADGKPASRSGLDPFITSLNGWMALTAGMGDLLIESTMDDEIKNILLDVEFATRDPQSIMAGAVNASDVWPSGACDNVRASSGSLKDNTSGKYPCKYRGIENPWGNQFRWRWDYLQNDHQPYVLDDPDNYDGTVNAHYTALSYTVATSNGYAVAMGFDENFPHCRVTTNVTGGSSTTYFADYYYQNTGVRALRVGGYATNGRAAGARCCDVYDAPGRAFWYLGGALSPA